MKINRKRFFETFNGLAAVGGTKEEGSMGMTGVNRPAFSPEDLEARAWFKSHVKRAGLLFKEDGIGNVSATLEAADANADTKTILMGSHMDSVPMGGKYDGALGVVAAIEVLQTIKDAGIKLPYHLEAISFSDEEGKWDDMLGSRGLAGQLTSADFEHPKELDSRAFMIALSDAALSPQTAFAAKRDPRTLKAWLEVHIEQGERLVNQGMDVGVVTSITGIEARVFKFKGRCDHAGTTPAEKRLDPTRVAGRFLDRAPAVFDARPVPAGEDRGTFNIGKVEALPGAFNIVPGEIKISVETRHGDAVQLRRISEAVISLAREIIEEYRKETGHAITLEVIRKGSPHPPAPTSEVINTTLERSCDELGLSHARLISYAGHDTQVMATVTEGGMIFIPSKNGGSSHCCREYSEDQDCINGANVLLHSALHLAGVEHIE